MHFTSPLIPSVICCSTTPTCKNSTSMILRSRARKKCFSKRAEVCQGVFTRSSSVPACRLPHLSGRKVYLFCCRVCAGETTLKIGGTLFGMDTRIKEHFLRNSVRITRGYLRNHENQQHSRATSTYATLIRSERQRQAKEKATARATMRAGGRRSHTGSHSTVAESLVASARNPATAECSKAATGLYWSLDRQLIPFALSRPHGSM